MATADGVRRTSGSGRAPTPGPLGIAILCHPTYGGSGVIASELALALADRGHCVHLFSYAVPPRLARSSSAVEVHVAQGAPYPLFEAPPHDLAITSAILNVHEAEGLDIVHAHYALPHAMSAVMASHAAAAVRPGPPPRVVTTLHGTDITLVGRQPSYRPLLRYALETSHAVTAVSKDLAMRSVDSFYPRSDGASPPVEVIPNFVNAEEFCPATGPSHVGAPRAIHISNFRPVKRVPFLVEAFVEASRDTSARLVLVGDGPDRDRAETLARELGADDRIAFLGERDVLPSLITDADLFLLASTEESFGLSALEAMACGVPVVAPKVGGLPEVVTDGHTGWLSTPGDRDSYVSALRDALNDPEGRAQRGAAARIDALERFSLDAVVGSYEALYRRLLSESAAT
jgi:N-acetyl-alpha-D-glucosaminyl L-malate synthase BshA